ncbi:MAG: enoyl-CoA hydratase/isomerase family protein [Chloroflexi bacterium]|nr:enoyl-CoA hydratase/isomerase family protein [Chloroflexota bacterium]
MAVVTLSCPASNNRIDQTLAAEIRQACRDIREDPEVNLVLFTGSGDCFSAGRLPVPPEVTTGPPAYRQQWIADLRVADSVAELPVPVVMALNGDTLDHGLELALAGDIRLADENARFGLTDLASGGFPGVLPWDGGTQRLPRLVGPAWAQDLILTGRVLGAHEALELGLVNRVTPPGQALAEARELAEQILRGGPLAARYVKEAVYQGMDLALSQGLALEADLNIILQSTRDRAEGLASFAEKRPPRYSGA